MSLCVGGRSVLNWLLFSRCSQSQAPLIESKAIKIRVLGVTVHRTVPHRTSVTVGHLKKRNTLNLMKSSTDVYFVNKMLRKENRIDFDMQTFFWVDDSGHVIITLEMSLTVEGWVDLLSMRWSVTSFINSVNSILEGVFVNDWLLEGFETRCGSINFLQRKSEFPCGFDLERPSPSATSVLFCIRMADLK